MGGGGWQWWWWVGVQGGGEGDVFPTRAKSINGRVKVWTASPPPPPPPPHTHTADTLAWSQYTHFFWGGGWGGGGRMILVSVSKCHQNQIEKFPTVQQTLVIWWFQRPITKRPARPLCPLRPLPSPSPLPPTFPFVFPLYSIIDVFFTRYWTPIMLFGLPTQVARLRIRWVVFKLRSTEGKAHPDVWHAEGKGA